MNLLKQIALVWIQYRAFRTTFAELSSMSDYALKDIGLNRGDIARVAFAKAERRTAAFAPSRPETHEEKSRDAMAAGASW
jgi:uncharacterized protein YjiS (DUF1127 family)